MQSNISQIIIRNKVMPSSMISMSLDDFTRDKEFRSIEEFTSYFGLKNIMTNVYKEEFDSDKIEETTLFKKYTEVLKTNQDNDFFKVVYKIREDLSLKIAEHINIYRLADDLSINGIRIIPWYYIESAIYIADTWWFEDQEVINDLNNLSFLDFMYKYKMY